MFSIFFILVFLVISHSSLICTPLMTNNIKHSSIHFVQLDIIFLIKFRSFVHFSIIYLSHWFVRVHFILDSSPLSSIADIFSTVLPIFYLNVGGMSKNSYFSYSIIDLFCFWFVLSMLYFARYFATPVSWNWEKSFINWNIY